MKDLLGKKQDLDFIVGDFNADLAEFGVNFEDLKSLFKSFKQQATAADLEEVEKYFDRMLSSKSVNRMAAISETYDVNFPRVVALLTTLERSLDVFADEFSFDRQEPYPTHIQYLQKLLTDAEKSSSIRKPILERWMREAAGGTSAPSDEGSITILPERIYWRAFAKWQLESFWRLAWDGRWSMLELAKPLQTNKVSFCLLCWRLFYALVLCRTGVMMMN